MPAAADAGTSSARLNWADEKLVAACRKGDQEAWSALIDKYKNLIYSIPIKMGLQQDAADVFQSVCLDLLSGLDQLREPKALPKWLIQICYHKCLASQRGAGREVELGDEHDPAQPREQSVPEDMMAQLQREQAVRSAVAALPPRCERMVRMLFYEEPPRPYSEVAKDLGLAGGSIGFIRGRCLERLRKQLEQMGHL